MSNKTALRACPVCNNREAEVLHHQRFAVAEDSILPDAYDVVLCTVCGFAYADTPASEQDYDRYYAAFSKYEDDKTSTGGGGSEWDRERLQRTARDIAAAISNRQARIVDVGCANGGLLAELKASGFTELLGVDPSPACARNCQQSYGIPAKTGALRDVAGFGRFDVVILSHVLEHVPNLASAARNVAALLNAGGVLYAEVPDASRYREFLIAPFQDFNTEHINHFAPFSLRNLFETHGFALRSTGQKEIESSPGCPYPVLFGFFDAPSAAGSDRPAINYKIDARFRDQLLGYIEASSQLIRGIDQKLEPFSDGRQPLIVWGTGQLTMKLLAETCLRRAKIAAFVDGNPINHGKKLFGVSIIAPEAVNDREAPIVIATLLHQRAIAERIRSSLRLENPLITLN